MCQITDRPTIADRVVGREYVQPQWVFDSFNGRALLPTAPYGPVSIAAERARGRSAAYAVRRAEHGAPTAPVSLRGRREGGIHPQAGVRSRAWHAQCMQSADAPLRSARCSSSGVPARSVRAPLAPQRPSRELMPPAYPAATSAERPAVEPAAEAAPAADDEEDEDVGDEEEAHHQEIMRERAGQAFSKSKDAAAKPAKKSKARRRRAALGELAG
jgi:hypothetical protein